MNRLNWVKSNLGLILFSLFILMFGALMVVVEVANHRFWTNDWLVYVEASKDYFNGVSPYGKAYGLTSGFFKYPPPTLYFFWITSKFSFFTTQVIHISVQLVSLTILLLQTRKNILLPGGLKKTGWLYLLFILIAVQVVRELHMGNINLELIALAIIGVSSYKMMSWLKASLLAIFVLFKPVFVVVLLPFAYPFSLPFLLKIAGVGLLVVALTTSGTDLYVSIDFWKGWIESILFHGEYIINQTSLSYLTKIYLGINAEWLPSIIALVCLTIALFTLYGRSKLHTNEMLYVYFASIPTLFKLDTQAFIFSLPLIASILVVLSQKNNWIINVLFIILLAAFSLNSTDLWGKELMNSMNYWGTMGIANIGLIVLFIYVRSITPAYEKVVE